MRDRYNASSERLKSWGVGLAALAVMGVIPAAALASSGLRTAPLAPTLSATAGNAVVSLSWTAPAHASSYAVLRCAGSGCTPSSTLSGTTSTSFTDTTAQNGTTYLYAVTASNRWGSSLLSNIVVATPIAVSPSNQTPPPAPSALTASGGNSSVSLTWAAASGAASYSIERCAGAGCAPSTSVGTTSATWWIDATAVNGTTYSYGVAALDSWGSSPLSNIATVTPGTGPTIIITSPAPGATVQSTITITGTDTVATGLATVQASIDGGGWQAAAGTSKFGFPVDTTTMTPGAHTVAMKVTDANGASNVATVSLNVVATPVYSPPSSIPANCSVPVDTQLLNWIATVPDHSLIRFGAGACYGEDTGLVISARNGLTLDGNGATFKDLTIGATNRCNFRLQSDSDLTLKNVSIVGANPNPGITNTGPYYNGIDYEWQHGVSFDGTVGGWLYNAQITAEFGDFVEGQYDWSIPFANIRPVQNVIVQQGNFNGNGRQGLGLTDVDGFVLETTSINNVNNVAIDLELDLDSEVGRNIQILNNTFGNVQQQIISNRGAGQWPNVGNVVFSGNNMPGQPLQGVDTCQAPILIQPPAGYYRSNFYFLNNHWRTFGGILVVNQVNNLVVSGSTTSAITGNCNPPPGQVGLQNAGVSIADCHTVAVTNNAFTGESYVVWLSDTLSTGVTQSGNTL